jgi:hypothetical protein
MTEWHGMGSGAGSVDERGDAPTLFAQTMGLVAATAGFFALGAYVAGTWTPAGRSPSGSRPSPASSR